MGFADFDGVEANLLRHGFGEYSDEVAVVIVEACDVAPEFVFGETPRRNIERFHNLRISGPLTPAIRCVCRRQASQNEARCRQVYGFAERA